MAEIEVRDRASFAAWLEDKPASVAQMLAMRIALRAMPQLGRFGLNQRRIRLMATAFRANFICWAARNYPAHDMKMASYTAYVATALIAAADVEAVHAIVYGSYAACVVTPAADAAVDAANASAIYIYLYLWSRRYLEKSSHRHCGV